VPHQGPFVALTAIVLRPGPRNAERSNLVRLPYEPRPIEPTTWPLTRISAESPRRCRSTHSSAGRRARTSSRTRPRRGPRWASRRSHRDARSSVRLESTRGSTSTRRRTATRSRSHPRGSPPHSGRPVEPSRARSTPAPRPVVAVHGPPRPGREPVRDASRVRTRVGHGDGDGPAGRRPRSIVGVSRVRGRPVPPPLPFASRKPVVVCATPELSAPASKGACPRRGGARVRRQRRTRA
jgi:hypothetical protein